MSDTSDTVLAYWNEHRQQLRQSENQRAIMTNFVLAITAALSALIVQQKFSTATVPLGAFITIVGIFGALISAKYHERATYHLSQARALTTTLKELAVLGDETALNEYRRRHYDAFPRLHQLRLHALWTGLHLTVSAYGSVMIAIAVFA